MALGLGSIISNLLEMDHIGTEVDPYSDEVTYIFKTTGLHPSIAEMKAKILSVLDFPVDIPVNVEIEEAKRGLIFKDMIVRITVKRSKIGSLENLLAKKYGIIRRKPYRR